MGSNPAGGMNVRLWRVLCIVRQRSLRRADHSSKGVIPSVCVCVCVCACVCVCVCDRNASKKEEALAHKGAAAPGGVKSIR